MLLPVISGAEGDPAPDGGDPTGGGDPGTGGDPAGTGPKPDDKGGKTFTQDEVNALLTREVSQKTRGKIDPSELGFKSKQELETFLADAKEKADKEKSEQERQLEEAKTEAVEEAKRSILAPAQRIMLKAEFKLLCAKHGVAHADDAFLSAQTLDEWKNIEVSEDGEVSGLDDAFFESFKEQKPFYFTPEPGTGDIGAGAGGGSPEPSDEAALARRYGALAANQPGLLTGKKPT